MSHHEQINPQKDKNTSELKNISCIYCKSKAIIKWCKRKTQNRGFIQRYCCKDCNKKFSLDDGFYRMRNNPQKITCAIDLFYRGVSTRKVQEHFQAFYPHNSSHKSIYKWVVKYSKLMHNFTGNLKLNNLGFEAQVDEIECHRRKSHKAKLGRDENWFIDSIDPKTKFMLSSNYCKSRSKKEIKAILKKIKQKAEGQIKVVTTDGLTTYENSVKEVFGYNKHLKQYNVLHHQKVASKDEGFNYPIERLHNSIRHRIKTFRGFHGSIESANAIMKGLEIYYNFITKHQAIKCSPYELATNIKLEDKNKWLELIYYANSEKYTTNKEESF